MGRVIISGGSRATIPYVGPKASLTPTSGVTYTDGLSGLEPAEISSYAQAISNVTGVTNDITAMYIDYGNVHRKISVGDQVTIGVNNVDYAFDVIGFNHDDLTDSMAYGKATVSGKAGMTLQLNSLMAGSAMNDSATNVGGWKNCVMRTVSMVSYFEQIKNTWKSIIKQVNKFSSAGNKSSTIETTVDKLFLLSEIEVFNTTNQSFAGEGNYYAYYKSGGSKIKTGPGTNNRFWWLRSPGLGVEYFGLVDKDGTITFSYANSLMGVSFAFCI